MGSIAYDKPVWKEVSTGRFERPIDAPEKLCKSFSDQGLPMGKNSILLTTIVDYATASPNVVDTFRQAWYHMRKTYPHIASHIIRDKRIYDIQRAQEEGEQSFIVIEDTPVEKVFAGLGLITGAHFYALPKQNKIMIASGHDFSDGRGQLCFLDKFFAVVEMIETGHPLPSTEVDVLSALAPAFDAIARPDVPAEAYKEAQAGLMTMMQHVTDGIGGHNLEEPSTGSPRWQGVQFSEKETSDIIRAVKARGTTVTPMVHTAVVVARNKITGTNPPYCALIPCDVRRYCGKHATQPFTSYLMGGVPTMQTGNFEETAKNMIEAYSHVRADSETGRHTAIAETIYEIMKSMPKGQCPPVPAKTSPDLSNPGKADDFLKPFYGGLEVRRVACQCRELFQMPFMVFLSFRGKFRASITYNDTYHREEEIADYARIFKTELLEGLGLEQEIDALEVSL